MIIGDGIMLGAGGETASIFVTGLSETDDVTATKDAKTVIGKWMQKPNPLAHGLPDGYTELEYIEGTGTQYIDTEIFPNQSTNVELDFAYTGAASKTWYPLFGVDSTNGAWYFSFVNNNSGYSLGYGVNKQYFPLGTYSGERKILKIQDGNLVVDGTTIKTAEPETFSAVNSMYLFAYTVNGSLDSRITSMRCYSFKVEKDGSLVRHFIPSKRNSDGANGMYDLVTNAFFENAGTGTFTAGPVIPQTIDGFMIDKIKDYGTWTITATDGTNTATQDVLVDAADVFSAEVTL